jgi:hypothetical protein
MVISDISSLDLKEVSDTFERECVIVDEGSGPLTATGIRMNGK